MGSSRRVAMLGRGWHQMQRRRSHSSQGIALRPGAHAPECLETPMIYFTLFFKGVAVMGSMPIQVQFSYQA